MCGIAGASLNPADELNARRIARAMLLSIESRGRDATGFAYRDATGAFQVHKDDIDATSFVKRRLCLPKAARTFIMHTRFATQGDPLFNENNHPIATGNVVGVHNGCISNDDQVFRALNDVVLGKDRKPADSIRIAEVDSEAIFANLAYGGVPATTALEDIRGSAAVAWLDANDGNPDTLHLARLNSSPLIVATTVNGSLLFASTQEAVEAGAKAGNLEIVKTYDLLQGTYCKVVDGAFDAVEEFKPAVSYRSYMTATTGRSAHHGITDRFDRRGTYTARGWEDFEDDGYAMGWGDPLAPTRSEAIAIGARNYVIDRKADETLDEKLAREDDELWARLDAGEDIDEDDEYEKWWELNCAEADAAAARDDEHTQARRRTAFALAPRLNAFFLSDIEAKIEVTTEAEYLSTPSNMRREVNIDKWFADLKGHSPGTIERTADHLKADVRPGATVITDIDGVEAYGHLYVSPESFPHGEYVIRAYVARARRKGGYEAVYVMRSYHEFEVVTVTEKAKAIA